MKKAFFLICTLIFVIAGFSQKPDVLLKKAAEGDSSAMIKLSAAYLFGNGVPMNEDSADYWAEQAAENGHIEGMYLVGIKNTRYLYDYKKFAKGVEWLKKAADKGNPDAMNKLREIYADNGYDVAGNTASAQFYSKANAFKYAEMAAKYGNGSDAFFCYQSLWKGSGVTRDKEKALEWLTFAADEKKYYHAQLEMGTLYLDGKINGQKEPFLAADYLNKAFESAGTSIELKNRADFELHRVDQFLKKAHNQMSSVNPLLSPTMFNYKARKL